MFLGLEQDLEKALSKAGIVDTKTADKFNNTKTALAVTDVVTGTGAAIATPAVAGAAGVGAAAATGTVALAAAFPIGTIIVAVPLVTSLGLSMAGKSADNKSKALTRDQEYLMDKINKYKKKDSKWRQKKAKDWLKDYAKHLANGNKKTLEPWDGNKKNNSKDNWKAKKAELEMDLTAIYIAEYKKEPPKPQTKTEQRKTRSFAELIRKRQKASGSVTSPYRVSGGKLQFDRTKMKKLNARMLQRPSEITRAIQMRPQIKPQPIAVTLQQSPAALDGALEIPGKKDEGVSKGLIGAGVLGVLGIASILI
jgi:hypothetical protein